MNRINRLKCMIVYGLCSHASLFAADEMALELEVITKSAAAGIPVVAKLTIKNVSNKRLSVPDQVAPESYLATWRWKCDGFRHPIRAYQATSFGQGIPPIKVVTLSPGEAHSWYCMLPTPFDFPDDKKWILTVEISRASKTSKSNSRVDVEVVGRPTRSATAGALMPALAQAAMLQYERGAALRLIEDLNLWKEVEIGSKDGDCVALLLKYSRALLEGDDILACWKKLDAFGPEVRCLRNYLFLHRTDGGVKRDSISPLAPKVVREVVRLVKPSDFFADEILREK